MDEMDTIRVLLALPAPILMAEYRTALMRTGYRVGMAADGVQCFRRIRSFRPDLIVLDVDLLWGGADGVLDVLKEETVDPPVAVLVIGSRSSRAALYRVARFAVTDYQSKPVTGQYLVRRIRELLEGEYSPAAGIRIGKSDE